ncbi:efflux RND transporter periplasmic adaptor subunit [Robiginitalea sp. SC105]|uniref:efflux RND transporter periplasmic adaptor subunit n=1 Tax=Robiginitalea sp. SC105 TaxID=2762332 RepID=UPI001639E1CC|nr:efflux RND transporter periplasmic adaptor subunit [Robiginitalea sp. SC105]MBC2838423.1 efflux RND transporter periplasmic adaptor subunit [Robiginitalea sp. SC105]
MKNTLLISLGLLLLTGCGNNSETSVDALLSGGDLEAIKARRQELSQQEKDLKISLRRIDSVIASREGNSNMPLVSTLELQPARFDHFLELQGDVQTKQNILLYPEMAGTLEQVYVKDGDQVRKGQALARIDDGGMASGLEQLRTQAALAETTFERQRRLWEQNIGSEIQYLQAKAQYESLTNQIRQAEAQLAKSVIRAPFSGIVDNVMQEQGSTVNPAAGMPVIRLVNLSDMYVEVDVPESYLPSVRPGKEVKIYLPVLGDSITTQVRQTGNYINPTNRSFSVEIPVPNASGTIKPNLTARVSINDYSSEDALLVPPSVISENADGQQYVYLAEDIDENGVGTAVKRLVTTGLSQGDQVEILSGIQAGDRIITEGARRVREGQEIQILNKA